MSVLPFPSPDSAADARRERRARRSGPRPARVEIDRAFWLWVITGLVFTCLVGVVYAHYLKRTYGWSHGTAWERVLLVDLHTPLPYLLDRFVLFLPWLGTNLTILPGIAVASYFLWKRNRRDLVVVLVVAAAGNYIVSFLLKYPLDRPRPTLFEARGEYTGPSFPSGHAMLATSVLFVVAYLLKRERDWNWPYVVILVFGPLTVYSRLYLGVHWPTDVIAGGILGVLWLFAMLHAMDARREELVNFGRRARAGEIP